MYQNEAQVTQPAVQSVPALPTSQELPPLEPFPFVPDPPQASKRKTQSESPLPRPTKFIPAGGARESDYESDYDGAKIRPRWTPAGSETDEPSYRKVRPKLSSGPGSRKQSVARTPTPPTVFDQPPSFDGPPRPVISPSDAEKIKSLIQTNAESPVQIVKPKPIRPLTANPLAYLPQPMKPYSQPAPPIAAVARNLLNLPIMQQ